MKCYIILIILFLNSLSSCIDTPSDSKKDDKNQELELLWSYEYERETKSLSLVSNAPTIIDSEMILTALDAAVTSIDLESGEKIWRYELIESVKLSTNQLLYDEDQVYVKMDVTNQMVVLKLKNGAVSWQEELDGGKFFDQQSDAISESSIYLTGDQQDIYEFSKSGEFIRRLQLEYSMRSGHYFHGDLIIAHGYRDIDLSPFAFGQIVRYDLEADTLKWKYETDKGGFYTSPILLEDEIIYAGTTEGPSEFVALSATTGEVLWRRTDVEAWTYTLSSEAIYINEGADLVALRKTDGQQLWRTVF